MNYSYAYDENGPRTQKTVTPTTNATAVTNATATTNGTVTTTATNGIAVTTNYYYNGSVLMGMVTGSGATAIHQLFSYDASGNVVSVDYSSNGGSSFTTYYYLRNAQNDVVKLIDGSGNTVVQYTYDSWGKHIATTDTLASTVGQNQPFRYRGYVIVGRMCSSDNSDTETGWYYLQSRYYDPTTCRFISADVLLSTGQGVLGHNAFAYCNNNPLVFTDSGGYRPTYVAYMAHGWHNHYVESGQDPEDWRNYPVDIHVERDVVYISCDRYRPSGLKYRYEIDNYSDHYEVKLYWQFESGKDMHLVNYYSGYFDKQEVAPWLKGISYGFTGGAIVSGGASVFATGTIIGIPVGTFFGGIALACEGVALLASVIYDWLN